MKEEDYELVDANLSSNLRPCSQCALSEECGYMDSKSFVDCFKPENIHKIYKLKQSSPS